MSLLLIDETSSDLPVKDTEGKPAVIRAIQVITGSRSPKQQITRAPRMKEKDLKTRRRVSLISREELEDNFLRLHEENLLLKDHARKQEDKIKRMSTKLFRVCSDLAKAGKTVGVRRDGRNLEAEETIEDLQDQVRDLQRRNEALRHRLTTYKQRLQVHDGCRHWPYSTVSARIDSGVRKNTALQDKTKRGLHVQDLEMGPPAIAFEGYGETLSQEARDEIDRLSHVIESHNSKLDERSAILLKNMVSMRSKDTETEMMLSLHKLQQAEDQRSVIQENVMLIRLQKELREKNTSLCALKEQFQQLKESYESELQEKQKSLTLSHQVVLTQLEDLSSQLKEERAKVVEMEIDQKSVVSLQRSLLEFQERVTDLEKEKELLKENYESLLRSSLNSESLDSCKATEKALRDQITQLEGQIRSQMSEHMLDKEQLQHEREQSENLKQQISQLQIQLLEKIQEVHKLRNQVSDILSSTICKGSQEDQGVTKHIVQDSNFEWNQRERVINKEKERWNEKRERMRKEESSQEEGKRRQEDIEMREEEDEQKRVEQERQRKIHELDAAHAETILELEKTREMLILQHQINNDYQEELKTVRLRAESESREKEEQERHYEARLLQRNTKIQTLEAQLKDIAYGTFLPRFKVAESPSDVEVSPPPSLHRGETLFEVHIGGICFTPRGLEIIDDPQPPTFCIYSFYEFETHATPVVTGAQPRYDFTSRYAVTPDPDFLRFLRMGTITVELYKAIGGDHQELARGRLKLEATLQSTDKVHGSVILTDACGEDMGELDYWLRLHGPISLTHCRQRQRKKASGYLSTHRYHCSYKSRSSYFTSGPQNELAIRIWGCRSLKVGRLGYQPSPYAVYRFYHHPDHSTTIIPCSNNPQFGDEAFYPLHMSIDLERYLQREHLYIYVFDDEDTQPGGYLGKAEVPLMRLAQGSNIQGDFALFDPHGNCSGSVQLSLEWKIPYQATGQNIWESVTSGHPNLQTPQETTNVQFSKGNLLSRDAQKVQLARSRPSKSRKAEEDQEGDMSSSKRGKRDLYTEPSNRLEQPLHRSVSPADGHKRDELDMDMNEMAPKKEVRHEEHMEEEEVNDKIDQEISSLQDFSIAKEETISLDRHILSEVGGQVTDVSESGSTDSDDIIIMAKPQVLHKPPSSMIRVQVTSLTLDPCSEVVSDDTIQRLFVEFRFAGVPLEETETPISLRKPNQGEEIYYHFSKVIHLDGVEHEERRQFFYMLLDGFDSAGERVRLKFTVVSDPINEEQEECRDVGYAYLDLRHLLKRGGGPPEETLNIVDVADQQQVIGTLRVMAEAKEAARIVRREKRARVTC
ncbi:X-linked retinitis pigmentosa GTPase regulator-interacting protein 1 [Rhinophrynus dorsalis]